jgi:curved DNA-binding protein CbpA
MHTRDYYNVLGLPPSATIKEIKTAYRLLAQQFHPDKTGNDLYATAQFELIKEAYEVLTSPSKKELYLQQRWYDKSIGKKRKDTIVTPVSVLKQMIELDVYVARLDVHRLDEEGLSDYLAHLLSTDTIEKLNSFNEKDVNKAITVSALKSGQMLQWKYAQPFAERLMQLHTDDETKKTIEEFARISRNQHNWRRLRPWLLLLAVLFLCGIIYIAADQGYLD